LERTFFHWITNRAVRELADERYFTVEEAEVISPSKVRFLIPPTFRYYKRSLKDSLALIKTYSSPTIVSDSAAYAEILFLNGLASNGFRCLSKNTNEFGGLKWKATNHNLDFIVERDSRVYGIEVKNRLDYIEH